MPKLSIAVPVYSEMPNGDFFYRRLVKSLDKQTFKDWELVVTKSGKMAHNTNEAIKRSEGEYIKILYQDDYLRHKDALQAIVDALDGQDWLVTGCNHDDGTELFNNHLPTLTGIPNNINTIGSPSVLTIRNYEPLLFDERMSWTLDLDYYKRMLDKFGVPVFLNDINVTIGIGNHQTTNILTNEEKEKEHLLMQYKYE
jgi:hypothetical protein